MAYKRVKDETNLIQQWTLKAGKGFYFHVFLWADQTSFDENTLDNKPNKSHGCVNLAPSIYRIKGNLEQRIVKPKLGEIHFIKDQWTLEIVAHELCHALIHRIRMIKPQANQIIEQEGDSEETICRQFGQWVDEMYRALWKKNPSSKWINKQEVA